MTSHRTRTRTFASALLASTLVFGFGACSSSSDDSAGDDTDVVEVSETEVSNQAGESSDPSADSPALPDDWPELLALPDGFTVEAVLPVDPFGNQKVMAEGPADTDQAAVLEAYTTAFADAGLNTSSANETLAAGRIEGGDYYTATFGDGLNDNGNVKLMLEVSPPLSDD